PFALSCKKKLARLLTYGSSDPSGDRRSSFEEGHAFLYNREGRTSRMTFEERLRARRAQIRAQLDGVDVTLLPYYGSARDRIIRPDRALILRRYFIERWLPRLTGDEMKLLVVLRNLAHVHGVEAENPAVEVTIRHLVDLTGSSRGTLNRLLAADLLRAGALRRFVQKEAQRA